MILSEVLLQMGLSKKEAKVYLACLELGSSSILQISQKSGVNRGTIYYLIEQLIKKALISQTTKKKRVFYVASEPNEIFKLLKDKEELLKTVLPDLNALNNTSIKKPKIRYYEGDEGIVKVYKNTLTTKKEMLSIANFDQFGLMLKADPDYVKKRVKKGIFLKLITTNTKENRVWKKRDKKEMRDMKLVSPKTYPFQIEIDIYDNFVNLTSYKEKIGIIIESKQIAETMRLVFNLCWDNIK